MLYKNKNDKIVIGISWTKNINNEQKIKYSRQG